MHEFIKMAGLKSEKEFYKKFKTPEEFFSKYPEARNGYTLKDSPPDGTAPQEPFISVPQDVNDPQPIVNQQSYSSANTTGFISNVADTATNVIGGVSDFWRNVQVAAPQLLNALIPDNNRPREIRPQVATNQYAYGTGSQMMYQNGGGLPSLTYDQAKNFQSKGLPYQVSQDIQSLPHNTEYPSNVLQPLPTAENFYNPSFRTWESLPEAEPSRGTIPLTIQEYIYDDKGRKTNQTQDVETLYFHTEDEKDKYLKNRRKEKGYGLWFKGDNTKTVAIDTRSRGSANKISMLQNGGAVYNEGGEYELDPSEIKRLRELGYEIEIV